MGRSVFRLLNVGTPWCQLSEQQQARWYRDRFFCSSAGAGRAFVSCAVEDKPALKTHSKARETFRARREQSQRHAHHFADASRNAYHSGQINLAEHRSDLNLNKRDGFFKHDRDAFPPLSGSGGKEAWADVQDDSDGSCAFSSHGAFDLSHFGAVVAVDGAFPKDLEAQPGDGGIGVGIGGIDNIPKDLEASANNTQLDRMDVDDKKYLPKKLEATEGASFELAEKLNKAHAKVVFDGLADVDCKASSKQSFYFDSQNLARSDMSYWTAQVADLRSENSTLFSQLQDAQCEVLRLRQQLAAAESAMQSWASHATTLEEALLSKRCEGGERQSFEVSDQLHSSTGSELGIDPHLGSSSCGQVQFSSDSGLRIESSHSDLRLEVLEKQMANLSTAHGDSLTRIDKLAKSLGENVQRSLETRCTEFLTAEGLQHQIASAHEQLRDTLIEQVQVITATTVERAVALVRSQVADKDSFLALQSAVFQSRDDEEKAMAQLWEAVHLLKNEVVSNARSPADLSASCHELHSSGASHGGDVHGTESAHKAVILKQAGRTVSHSGTVRVGDIVLTHSLQNSCMNGQVGVVTGFSKAKQRYSVRLAAENGEMVEKLLKECNLRVDAGMEGFAKSLAKVDQEMGLFEEPDVERSKCSRSSDF